jgi:hypothetical protein
MAKTNYGQVKRQKEAARKAKHQKKLDRRQARPDENAAPDAPATDAAAEPAIGAPTGGNTP